MLRLHNFSPAPAAAAAVVVCSDRVVSLRKITSPFNSQRIKQTLFASSSMHPATSSLSSSSSSIVRQRRNSVVMSSAVSPVSITSSR